MDFFAGSGLVTAMRGDSKDLAVWEEISGVATGVVRTAFKNFCSCRSVLSLCRMNWSATMMKT